MQYGMQGQNQFNPYGGYGYGQPPMGGQMPMGGQFNPLGGYQGGGGGYPQGGAHGGGWSGVFGGLGNLFGDIFGSHKKYPNPADSAMPYLDKIPGTVSPYFDPYINAGRSSLNTLMGQYGNLVNDPTAMMNKIGAGYQKSPGYDFQVNQALGAANRAGAAGGMLGSPMEQQNIAGTVNQLANQDYYNYVDRGLQQYGQGLGGLGNINQMGFGASGDLASMLAQALMNQGNLAYAGQANQNSMDAAQRAQRGNIFSDIGNVFGSYFDRNR